MSMEENDDSTTPAGDACYQKTEQNSLSFPMPASFPPHVTSCFAKALASTSSACALVGFSNFPTDYRAVK